MTRHYENMRVVEQIRDKVRMVVRCQRSFGVLSGGEKLAVAFVLDRFDLMQGWATILDGVDSLGFDWLSACMYVQRNGWDRP